MRAMNGIEIVPLGKLSAGLWTLISPMQQSLAQTRRSFPELIGRECHALDGFLREVRYLRENPAQEQEGSQDLKAFAGMLHCIPRITMV